ncbi:MAG: SurA N-terminal domain-containing protein [Syntrophales bacterium]|nr:SurA N-terminal domain-containing protein [Syntrophales bacterium]
MRNLIGIITMLIFVFFVSTQDVKAVIVDRIVAIVNNEVITLSELNAAFEPYLKNIDQSLRGTEREKLVDEGKKAVLNQMINTKLIEQEAKKSGITVKDEEVMGAIRETLKRKNISLEEFVVMLEREGETLDGYKKEIYNQILRQRLIGREIRAKAVVSEEEIGEYYRVHREDYEGKEAVRVKKIFLPAPAEGETREDIKRQIYDIYQKILAGESFEVFASKYALSPELAASGGDIGFVERGTMIPELEKEVFSLRVNEVSRVIELSHGFYILKVIDKRGAGLKPFQEVRNEIIQKIEEMKTNQLIEKWLNELRKKSYVEIRL